MQIDLYKTDKNIIFYTYSNASAMNFYTCAPHDIGLIIYTNVYTKNAFKDDIK